MIRKVLIFSGLAGLGYAFYNYFNKQLFLANQWEVKILNAKFNSIDKNGANLDLTILLLNKSSFAIEIQNYDLDILYDKKIVGKVKYDETFIVESDTWFSVPTNITLDFKILTRVLGDLGLDVLKDEPINIDIKGNMNTVFMGLNKQVIFDKKNILLSENIASDLGLGKSVGKITNVLGKLGLKL